MNIKRFRRAAGLLTALFSTLNPQFSTVFAQGGLTPPGAPAPTMKSLDQLDAKLEKRTPIGSVPVTISSPGSYYVTTNLTGIVGSAGISIAANDVSLDLNGFALAGPVGSLAGISIGAVTNVFVRNGVLRNWPSGGIDASLARYCRFADLRIFRTAGYGLSGGTASVVDNCSVVECAGGISVLDGSRVTGCLAVSNSVGSIGGLYPDLVIERCSALANSGGGIVAGLRGRVKDCVAENNAFEGIISGDDSVVDGCIAAGHPSKGFDLGNASRVFNSVAVSNADVGVYLNAGGQAQGCIAAQNPIGFSMVYGGSISDCIARSNVTYGVVLRTGSRLFNSTVEGTQSGTGMGINLGSSNAVVDGCHIINNVNLGISSSAGTPPGGNLVIRNTARGNGNNYNLPTNTMTGPIISFGSGANGLTGVITNSSPWANFSY